ncbi:MAG: PEP-utilizing enzyme [Candidatus Poribacteria bacterium]|nr:PEP-utilizing enzyme [Candidatus Poribacteria bacterium]
MTWIKSFAEIDDGDLPLVGGKGLNLGKLTRSGFVVPSGFCVTTTAYRAATEGVHPSSQDAIHAVRLPDALQAELVAAYDQLGGGSVAVRSSATAEDLPDASFAGQQDTFLNVSGGSEVLAKMKACWASLWSERAVAYRRDHGIDDAQLAMAVVVQAMIDPDVSGVMFTVNPTAPDELVIESNWGLGESVVSGEVTPDHFTVSRETGEVTGETVVTKRKMSTRKGLETVPIGQRDIPSLQRGQISELTQLGMQVEAFYGAPQDIEWGLADGQFYLLQARPITTLTDAAAAEQLRRREIEILEKKADAEGTIWSRFNLSEVLPAPLPMTWAVIKDFMSGRGGFGLTYRDLGFFPGPRVDAEGVLDLICGRIYFNLSREAELYFYGFPLEHNFEQLKRDPQKAIYPQATTNIKRSTASFWFKLPAYVVKMVAADRKLRGMRADFDRILTEKIFPAFEEYVQTQKQIPLEELSDRHVIAKFNEWREKTLNEFAKDALKATVFAGFSFQQLEANLQKCFGEEEAGELTKSLITGLEGDLTVETNLKMWAVAQDELPLQDFLEQYGHRAVGEFELAQPRWREDPSYVEQIIASFRANPDANPEKHFDAQRVKREEAERGLAALPRGKAKQVNRELDLTQRYMPFRESAKFYLMLGYALIRSALVELDRRYQLDGGIFYLTPDELEPLTSGEDFRSVIAARQAERAKLLRIELPDVIYSDTLNRIGEPPSIETRDEIRGVGVSLGVATGEAYILLDATDAQITGKDYILVCPSTDPGWTPLFLHAAGLVMERGGMLSHGAVVAREYGIPAVVNATAATKRIQSGQRVRVDGNRGVVSILDAAGALTS